MIGRTSPQVAGVVVGPVTPGEDEEHGAAFTVELEDLVVEVVEGDLVVEEVEGDLEAGEGWTLGRPHCSERRERTGCAPTPPVVTTISPGAPSVRSAELPGQVLVTPSVRTFPSSLVISRKVDVSRTNLNPSCWMPALIIRMETAADPTADFSTFPRTRIPRKTSARISRMVAVPGTNAGSVTLTISIINRSKWPDTPVGPG